MRSRTLLPFLAGALIALFVVSISRSTRLSNPQPVAPAAEKPKPGSVAAAILPPISVLEHAPRTAAPAVARQRLSANPKPVANSSASSSQPATVRVRMERDPNTGELRPCADTTPAATSAAVLPPPPLIAAATATADPVAVSASAPPLYRTVVLRQGTIIPVRLSDRISTRHSRQGERFYAILDEP